MPTMPTSEVRCQWSQKDYVSSLQISLALPIFNSAGKTKLATLAVLCGGELVKNFPLTI